MFLRKCFIVFNNTFALFIYFSLTTILVLPYFSSAANDDNNSVSPKRNESQGVRSNNMDIGMNNFDRQSRHSLTHLVGSTAAMSIGQRNFIHSNSLISNNNHHNDGKGNPSYLNGNGSTRSINNNVTTIVEPDNSPSPFSNHLQNMNFGQNHHNRNSGQLTPSSSRLGRASAPPQVFDDNNVSLRFNSQSASLRKETANSLQQRAAQLIATRTQPESTIADTPVPSFANDEYRLSATPSPHIVHETEAQNELRPYVWSSNAVTTQNNIPSPSSGPSRALAIFGVSQLSVAEVRSTCEAFGSLLYFRSEFLLTKNVIFIAYHDLRSACQASNELRTYLQKIASSNINEVDVVNSNGSPRVMFCVSLAASSEYDESALMFSHVPFGINEEAVTQLMASFGAVQSVDQCHVEHEVMTQGNSFLVRFYDIQDANHCMLEMQSTMPWGYTVQIKSRKRLENERKLGQDFLALISRWRMATRPLASSSPSSSNTVPKNIGISNLHPSPSPTGFSEENRNASYKSTPPTSLESTSPPLPIYSTPAAPQLMVGPDGQYSYVIVQPSAYHASVPQFVQNTVIPTHTHSAHQPHAIPSPQIVFDGQNYWVQHNPTREHIMPNPHVPNFHHVPAPHVPYPVLPVYSNSNTTVQSIDSSGPNYFVPNQNVPNQTSPRSSERSNQSNGNVDTSNQRKALDIDAVKQGWDVRTSLMIRNIPNKYTRSMLLSEFKECGHGPGKIDFFYLPIDFRNKCNRGYAFVNFVNYRDIISFYEIYNSKGWKTFKSDKICEITYARIQGKMSMLKRFQNSALMEKDPEYRPVVFNANGEVCTPNGENDNCTN